MRLIDFLTFLALAARLVSCYDIYANVAKKFEFLPVQSEKDWGSVIRGPDAIPECAELYQSYLQHYEAQEWHKAAGDVYEVSDCILTNAQEMRKKTMDAAAVLLGLTPILFASVGPSLSELGLISSQRPLLALMFSLGTVAVFPSRVLSYYDDKACEILERRSILDRAFSVWLRRKNSRSLCLLVGVLQYIIVAAAIVNITYTAWELGKATVFIAECPFSFFPMVWTLLPLFVHLWASAALHSHRLTWPGRARRDRRAAQDLEQTTPLHVEDSTASAAAAQKTVTKVDASTRVHEENEVEAISKRKTLGPHRRHDSFLVDIGPKRRDTNPLTPAYRSGFRKWAVLQLMPSAAHPVVPEVLLQPTKTQILLHNFATGLGFAQVVLGTIIFSSLLFISIADAGVILLRFFASVAVCRIIMASELGGMRTEEEAEEAEQAEDEKS